MFFVAVAAATIVSCTNAVHISDNHGQAPSKCGGLANGIEVPMSAKEIVYSPYNWQVTDEYAKTINSGAYFRFIFNAEVLILSTDTSAMNVGGKFSQFWTRVDGGPLVQHVLADGNPDFNITFGPPFSATDNHLLEVIVKSTTETASRWNPQSTAVIFDKISMCSATAKPTITKPTRKPFNVLIYGDSITEGVRTLGYEGIPDDTDRNDAVRDYSFQLSLMLPIEIGIVAFGASGFSHDGSGAVPPLGESWNQLWNGTARDFHTYVPDLIIYNEGTNDRNNITDEFVTVVKALLLVAPSAKQLLLLPFNGGHRADISATVTNFTSANIVFGDTAGFYSGSDGLHPFGYNHVGQIAPRVAELCYPLLPRM